MIDCFFHFDRIGEVFSWRRELKGLILRDSLEQTFKSSAQMVHFSLYRRNSRCATFHFFKFLFCNAKLFFKCIGHDCSGASVHCLDIGFSTGSRTSATYTISNLRASRTDTMTVVVTNTNGYVGAWNLYECGEVAERLNAAVYQIAATRGAPHIYYRN